MKWKWIALILLLVPASVCGAELDADNDGDVDVDKGGTGATSASEARTNLGLGTASTRDAEGTLTDGANLPDGAAIIDYGDANWGGTGNIVEDTTPELGGPLDLNGELVYDGTGIDDDDCTGDQGKYWWDSTDNQWEFCNANSGTPIVIGSGSGSQTPWAQNIDTADYELVNTTGSDGHITAGDDIIVDKIGETEDAIISTDADDGEFSGFKTLKDGSVRWSFGASTATETGSDAGSNFFIGSVDDADAYQGAAIEISRATHAVEFDAHTIFPTYLELDEQSTDPGDPASGKGWLYLYDDGSPPSQLIFEDDSAGDHVVMTGVHTDSSPQLGGNLDVSTYELQSDGNIVIQLGDNAASYAFIIQDSDGTCVYAIDSDGSVGCP